MPFLKKYDSHETLRYNERFYLLDALATYVAIQKEHRVCSRNSAFLTLFSSLDPDNLVTQDIKYIS